MFAVAHFVLAQAESYQIPSFFVPVALLLLAGGALGWLVAAVLGFARARAFGASARWFTYAAVCLLIYHLQFLLLAFKQDQALAIGAFFNLFVMLASICAIIGFVRLTTPR